VYYEALTDPNDRNYTRYKLLTNGVFRGIVSAKLKQQYLKDGLIEANVNLRYGLAAGNIHQGNEGALKILFSKKGWVLITPDEIRAFIEKLCARGWEDDLVTITSKLLRKP
jgi:hypothetical protein